MNVALPEVDGRLLTRAVSFKGAARWDAATQTSVVAYEPVADRIDFVADLARNWLRLRRLPAGKRQIAIMLSNYPNRSGRLGNGVGLDTTRKRAEEGKSVADRFSTGVRRLVKKNKNVKPK